MSSVTIEQIIDQVKEYNPTSNSELIYAAYQMAEEAHHEQKRDSGEPYIVHPLEVTQILALDIRFQARENFVEK